MDIKPQKRDGGMKNRNFILLLVVYLLLLTGCTKNYYENKGDKYFAKDYGKA